MKIKKIPANYVAVKIDNPAYDQIKTKGGLELYIDPNFDFAKHVNHYGEVIAVPEKLIFDKKDPNRGLMHHTEMELQVGDKVYIDRREVMICLGDKVRANDDYKGMYPNKYIENEDGTLTLFVRYDMIWMAIRNGNYMPVNGWLIIEYIKEEEYEGSIIIPDSLKSEYNPFIGRVLYAGKRILEYQSETQTDSYNIEVGDIVLLPKYGDIFLENELHSMLGKKVFVCQRYRLVSTYNDLKGLCDQAGVELNINKVRIKYK